MCPEWFAFVPPVSEPEIKARHRTVISKLGRQVAVLILCFLVLIPEYDLVLALGACATEPAYVIPATPAERLAAMRPVTSTTVRGLVGMMRSANSCRPTSAGMLKPRTCCITSPLAGSVRRPACVTRSHTMIWLGWIASLSGRAPTRSTPRRTMSCAPA